jgi:histidine ammonia-lyase
VNIVIDKQLVTLAELRRAWSGPVTVSLGMDARRSVAESSEYIGEVVGGGTEVYGVNTGFGQLARTSMSPPCDS